MSRSHAHYIVDADGNKTAGILSIPSVGTLHVTSLQTKDCCC